METRDLETPPRSERIRLRRERLLVTGTVQGVGFRPHVHRLATELGLTGEVGNDTSHVRIEVEGPAASVASFRDRVAREAPPLARIDAISSERLTVRGDGRFTIVASHGGAGPVTNAPPDTAPCSACRRELADPEDRRFRHPFISCTDCGPRFTIIEALPYDRPATTMAAFPLCGPCAREYADPGDRRFHAQPVACHDCGPRLRLETVDGDTPGGADGRTRADRRPGAERRGASDDALLAAQRHLAEGAVVAVKGVGGYHLACRADHEQVVTTLRRRKQRPGKPFALMVRDLTVARRLAHVDRSEAALLESPAAPIVLLRRRRGASIARSVAPGNPLVGLMLPSSPLHLLLFAEVPGARTGPPDVLVMTSGNLAEEPLCTDDDDARHRLHGIADAFLVHDRPIAVACDDSVVRLDQIDDHPAVTLIRRSRGYVPDPIPLPFVGEPTLAVGGQLKSTACLTDGHTAWMSAHLGDMGSLPTLQTFERTVGRFAAMHEVVATRIVADAHPDYTTHRWATAHAGGRPVVRVQHHHAHVAAVLAEHGVDPSTRVVGIAFDGTGFGTDGTIWGGEVLISDYDGFVRAAHLATVPLPGGDAAIRHPSRVALAHLRAAGIDWDDDLSPVAATGPEERQLLATQLDRGVNTVATSSMGRLFDAVASLLGLRHTISFEAQAAIELEILAAGATAPPAPIALPLRTSGDERPATWDTSTVIRGVLTALRRDAAAEAIALGFHVAIADAVRDAAVWLRDSEDLDLVALSGGVFTNALLTRLAHRALTDEGFRVLRHRLVPPNDGGLALGQVAIGARAGACDDISATGR